MRGLWHLQGPLDCGCGGWGKEGATEHGFEPQRPGLSHWSETFALKSTSETKRQVGLGPRGIWSGRGLAQDGAGAEQGFSQVGYGLVGVGP